MSTPADASGATATLSAAAGLKGLGAAALFATSFVASVALIVQNVGTPPQAAIARTSQTNVSSVSSFKLPGQAQILGSLPFGATQVMVRMPAFTTPGAADRLGQTYGMELVGSYPAFGRYLFNLPQIRVEPAATSGQALVFFPPRTAPGDINAYLTANQLKVEHWYRSRVVDGESPERIALVTLPRINPVLVDGVRGIWKANIPLHIDQTRLSDWAATSGIHVISYDPATGSLLIKGPSFAPPKPAVTTPPARRVVTQHVVTPPAPQVIPTTPLTTPLFVTFEPNTTSDVALAAIQQAGGQMVSFDATTALAVVNVTSGNPTAVTTLLSAVTTVKCVNTSATALCTAAPPAVIVPAITPAPAPVALRVLPDTSSLSGTVLLSVDVQSSDGTGMVEWTLSGALASTTIGTAPATPLAGNPLAWTSTVNFDSTTVPDGAYTLTIRIQDGSANVTLVTRSLTVANAKPAQPTGFAAAPVPAGVALTWQQPAAANAALYRITRDGVQLVELPVGSTSYLDATASAGAHSYQLVVVDQSGATSDPVTTTITVAAPVAANQVTLVVRLASGEQLAADGLAGGHLVLSASALQGSTALAFEYTSDGTSWMPVPAAVTCSAQCTADWNLTGIAPGHYRVRAAGNQLVSDDAGFIVAAAAALPAPTALVATATTWGVDLHWIAPAGLIPPAYLVSRQTATGWSSLAQSSSLDYTDASAGAGQSYSYRVQAIGSDGAVGTPSDPASITLRGTINVSAAAGPVAPAGLRVIDGSGGATLLWQPVTGATGYVVERALDSAGTFVPLPAVATPMFRDLAQRVGGQVFYRVRSVGPLGAGDPSAVVAGIVLPGPAASTPAPFVVASAPGQLASSTGQVELGESQSAPVRAGNSVAVHAGGSTAGVERADVQRLAGTSWLTLLTLATTVTPAGWSAATSIDLSGVGAGDLQLRAVAKSADGAPLAVTAPASVQVVHSAPVPTALRATASGTAVSLSWTAPASSVPLTYNVYRASAVGGYGLAASGLTAPAFDDQYLAGKLAVSYVVTATDDLGNQSAWSAPANLVTPAAWSQAAPTVQFVLPSSAMLTAGDTALLEATASSSRGIASFSFAYSPPGSSVWINLPDRFPLATGGPTIAGLIGLATWGALFRTPGLAAGTYTVRATATDTLGHSTQVVRALTVNASQSRGPPAPDFTLNATASVGAVHLSWNAAGASYQVERSTDGAAGPFKAIGTTTSNTFDDHLLIPGFAYAYRVISLGAASSISSTVTVAPLAALSSGTTSLDQLVNVLLPAVSAGQLNISVAPANLTLSMQAGVHAFGSAYEINATSLGSGAQVHQLDQAATLTFTLPAGLSAAQAAGLAVYHWDVARGAWVVESSTVDLATGRITATVSHFSTFVVGTGTVSGTVFEDPTGDGFTSEDTPLAGITINLYLDGGATLVFSTTSAADGTYSFGNLGPAFYTVQEVVPAGYIETTPTSVTFSVISGFNPVVDFDNFKPGTLSGSVLQDVTGNGFSVDDTPIAGVTVELLLNGSTTPVAATASAIDGMYSFADLGPGSYSLREVVPVGFALSRQPYGPIEVTSGLISTGNDFDNAPLGVTADLSVEMTGPASAVDGSEMTFLITVTNNGLHDAVVSGLTQSTFIHSTFVSLTWVPLFSPLAPLDQQVFTLVMKVDPGTQAGTVITTGVTVSSSTPDPRLSNNTASVSTTVSDEPLSAAGVNVASIEGATFDGLVATFTDPTITAVAGDFTATIDWGDITQPSDGTIIQVGPGSFSVTGSHIYLEEDLYSISVAIFDIGGASATTTSAATVADAPFTSATGRNITATPAFSGQVASFTDADFYATITDYTVTIDWGDYSPTSAGTVLQLGPQIFQVNGAHTYTAGGTFGLTIDIVDVGGSHIQVIGSAFVPAADLALTKTALNPIALTDAIFNTQIAVTNHGPQTAFNVVVVDALPAGLTSVTFAISGSHQSGDTCVSAPAGHLTCTIAELLNGETVFILVSAIAVNEGQYTDTATATSDVQDFNPANNTADASTTVNDGDLSATGVNIVTTEGAPSFPILTAPPRFTGIVANLTDANPNGLASDFTATINWGDGTAPSAGTIGLVSPGHFSISGSHTYLEEGTYTISVAITDIAGPTTSTTSTAGVVDAPILGANAADPLSLTQGVSFTADLAGFAEGNYSATLDDWSATIDWGDGTISAGTMFQVGPQTFGVSGTHTYMTAGTFHYTVSFVDVGGTRGSVTGTAIVAPSADLVLTKTGPETVLAGHAIVYTVTVTNIGLSAAENVNVHDPHPAFTNLVSATQLSGPALGGTLLPGDSMVLELRFHVDGNTPDGTVLVNTATATSTTFDPNLANNSSSVSTTALDGELRAAGVDIAATEGATFTGVVANLTDANDNGQVADFTATINWGDGSGTSAGTIVQVDAGVFSITGSHIYLDEGSYPVSVSVVDFAGPTATAASTATVGDAALTGAAVVNINATRGEPFSGLVAGFFDANPNATISDYTVTIDWGDGSPTSAGTVFMLGPLAFGVLGSHTFIASGILVLTVDIVDDGGSTAHAVGTATVAAAADLSILMTGPSTVVAGTQATYSITVTNNGPDSAENVTVSYLLPAHTTLVSFAQNPGPLFGGTLAAGDTLTFTLVVRAAANAPEGSVLSVVAYVTSTTTDPNLANNSSTVNTTVTTQADVALTKTGPATVVAGANLTYLITITNHGPSDAQNVNLLDPTPLHTSLVSFTQTNGPSLGGTLPAGGSMAFTLVVFVPGDTADGTVITNTAEVRTTTFDTDHANNTSSVETTVVNRADLAIVKTGPATAVAGTNISYTITVTNNGTGPAANVHVSDTLSSHMTLVSFVQDSGPAAGGTLPANETMTFTLIVTVLAGTADGTVLTNTASVSSSTPDLDLTNNSSTVHTTVINPADLVIVKTGPATAVAGTNISYTITVTNNGPLAANNVSVSDTIPSHTTLVSFVQDSGPADGGTLPANGTMTFTVIVTVLAGTADGTVLTNTASVSSSTPDTNLANNTASADTVVGVLQPHAVITTPAPPIYVNEDITLSGASSYHDDPNRSIVRYEWDFAYNAALGFHVQATGQVVTKIGGYPAPGTYTVALRVTDDNPAAQGGPQSSIATADITVVAAPQADLELVKSVSPVSVLAGSAVAYTFTITNHGPQAATNVFLSDDLADSLAFQSFGAGTGVCSVSSGPNLLGCAFGTVAAGATVQQTINFTATAAGDFLNTATVGSSTADPNAANNTSAASLHVASPVAGTPDLIAADDTGISDTDNKTRITQPRFDVAAQAGLLVELLVDGVLVGAAVADSSGQARIQVDLAHALSDGIHLVTARVSVSSTAGPESAALSVLVDTAAPTGTFKINGDAPIIGGTVATDDPNLLLQLTFADNVGGSGLSRMAVSSDGGGTFEPEEDYGAIAAVTLPGPDGLFTVAVRVTDVAGNVVTVLKSVRLDTTGPVIVTSGVANGTTYDIGVTLHVTYGATDAGVGLATIGATLDTTTALASGAAIATSSLTAGAHTIVVTATDLLGNQSVVTISFEVSASALGLCAGVRDGVSLHLINPNMANPLCAKARAAQAAINRGDYSGARGVLGAFIHQVAAQSGKKIDTGYAGLLTSWANDLISRLP